MTRHNGKLYSLARDVMTPRHGRNFQYINLFLSGAETTLSEYVVRIFDSEWQNNQTIIKAHQFGDPGQVTGLETSTNLLVRRGNMWILLP